MLYENIYKNYRIDGCIKQRIEIPTSETNHLLKCFCNFMLIKLNVYNVNVR